MEIEIKLSARPDLPGGPEQLRERLRTLQQLDAYWFGPAVCIRIRDVYFDTPAGSLGIHRVAVRLRLQDGAALVTVKARRMRQGSLAVRDEVELPLTPMNLEEAMGPLRVAGILPAGSIDMEQFASGQPSGPLVPILDTSTDRWARSVCRVGGGGVVAELTLDRVTYVGLAQPFYDVEIGMRDEGRAEDLRALESALLEAAPGLAPSTESKLVRGLRLLGLDRSQGSSSG